MAGPVYKLYMGRPTEAWHQLTPDEQAQLLVRVDGALAEAGGERLVACDAAWASERWRYWGVERFPDVEAAQRHAELLDALHWLRYVDSVTVLGTESQSA